MDIKCKINTRGVLFECLRAVEQYDQLEICLPSSGLLTGISMLPVFQNLRWNNNKITLFILYFSCRKYERISHKFDEDSQTT